MLPTDQSTTPPVSTDRPDLFQHMSDAVRGHEGTLEDMQQRLAQIGRQIDQVRAGLPDEHADALERIEDGIDGLGERMAALARRRSDRNGPSAPSQSHDADFDAGWDAESAEALTRVYEMAEAEWQSSPPPKPRPAVSRAMQRDTEPASGCNWDGAWLEERFAELAGLLSRSLRDATSDTSLAALNARLDRFGERLDAMLDAVAQRPDLGALSLIEAHITELTAQFEATRGQLGRLDAIDTQLRELAQVLGDRQQGSQTGDTIESIIKEAAERAASQLAAAGLAPEPDARTRLEALEGLLQEYLAERRRGEEASAGVLHTIEDALVRIVDRVDAMEAAKVDRVAGDDADGLTIESDRLAEAYAAGARVLGHEPAAARLDAADYVPAARHPEDEAIAPTPASGDGDVQTRHELRASAMRAKLKAQGTGVGSTGAEVIDGELGADRLGAGEAPAQRTQRTRVSRTSAGSAGSRVSLLLAAMVSLCGTGYLVVDALMGSGATVSTKPAAEPDRAAAKPGRADSSTAAGRTGFLPTSDKQPGAAAPQPPTSPTVSPPQRAPEVLTDDRGQAEPPATRSQARQRARADTITKSVPITTATLSQVEALDAQEGELPLADVAQALGMEAVPPAGIGPAALRYAAASGDPAAQFEVAMRFAEGKGVAQDYKQALAWYQRAASRGHAAAQFRMAGYLERGVGTTPDVERAKVWYGARRRAGPRAGHAQPGRAGDRARRGQGGLCGRGALVYAGRRARPLRQPVQPRPAAREGPGRRAQRLRKPTSGTRWRRAAATGKPRAGSSHQDQARPRRPRSRPARARGLAPGARASARARASRRAARAVLATLGRRSLEPRIGDCRTMAHRRHRCSIHRLLPAAGEACNWQGHGVPIVQGNVCGRRDAAPGHSGGQGCDRGLSGVRRKR